jgi:hypothetical protein
MARARRLVLGIAAAGLALTAGGVVRPVPEAARPTAALRTRAPARAERSRAEPAAPPAAPPASSEAAAAARRDERRRPVGGRSIVFGLAGGPPSEPQPGTPAEAARRLLETWRHELGLDLVPGELRVASERTDAMGHHLRLRQHVGGVPVEGSEVAAHVGADGRPLLLVADVFPVRDADPVPRIGAEAAVAAARALVADPEDGEAAPFEHRPPGLLIRPEGRGGRLVWRVDVRTGDESARVSVDARDGEVADVRDLRRAAEVAGTARVFAPNPVWSSRNSGFSDRKDASSPMLEAQMATVTLPRLDGTGYLRGRWCDAARGRGNVATASLDWTALDRDDDLFEAVNVYFHVDRTQEELQRVGFSDVNAEPQRASPHALAADQSYFDEYDDTLQFGDGGVDDAEDGDIVVHEYGHAIQADMVPEFGGTAEGQAVGEGFSDFLACVMHADRAAPDPAWDPLVGCWDATSYSNAIPPYLRRVDLEKTYPRDLEDEPHADGEIWSRFLWDLRVLLGHDDSLRVAVGAHAYMNPNSKFREASNAVLVANFYLREGRDDAAIRALLRARGLPFNMPPLDAPPEDAYDAAPGNDDASRAKILTTGYHTQLLLADDDWYRVTVQPFRRLRVQADFDPVDLDLDLAVHTTGLVPVDESATNSGQEVVEASAGAGGATFLVKASMGPGTSGIDGYSLLVQELDLAQVAPGRTVRRDAPAGGEDAVTFPVGVRKVDSGSRVVVTSATGAHGARNDVRVTSPSGVVVADFGDGRTARGARVSVPATETGAWRIEVRPRDGSSGRYTIQARFRRGRP